MYPVTVELAGTTYRGKYAVRHRLITVSYNDDDDTRQVGDSSPDALAQQMLCKLIPKAARVR